MTIPLPSLESNHVPQRSVARERTPNVPLPLTLGRGRGRSDPPPRTVYLKGDPAKNTRPRQRGVLYVYESLDNEVPAEALLPEEDQGPCRPPGHCPLETYELAPEAAPAAAPQQVSETGLAAAVHEKDELLRQKITTLQGDIAFVRGGYSQKESEAWQLKMANEKQQGRLERAALKEAADRTTIERLTSQVLQERSARQTADAALVDRDRQIAALQAQLVDRGQQMAAQQAALVDRDRQIAAQQAALVERDQYIAALQAGLVERGQYIAALQAEVAAKSQEVETASAAAAQLYAALEAKCQEVTLAAYQRVCIIMHYTHQIEQLTEELWSARARAEYAQWWVASLTDWLFALENDARRVRQDAAAANERARMAEAAAEAAPAELRQSGAGTPANLLAIEGGESLQEGEEAAPAPIVGRPAGLPQEAQPELFSMPSVPVKGGSAGIFSLRQRLRTVRDRVLGVWPQLWKDTPAETTESASPRSWRDAAHDFLFALAVGKVVPVKGRLLISH